MQDTGTAQTRSGQTADMRVGSHRSAGASPDGSTGAGEQPATLPTGWLFERIGRFLDTHGLSPVPPHFEFAFATLSAPDQPLGKAVAKLTEQGVRLTRVDIERLGWRVVDGPPLIHAPRNDAGVGVGSRVDPSFDADASGHADTAIALVTQTQQHVDGFARMMRTMQDDTRGFGRDLARSAASITKMAEIDEITQITSTMIARIHDSEVRLAVATAEVDALRAKLAEARDIARRDVLTGLPNRRAFEEALAERGTHGGPHCLAVCDIDRFKRVNDLHGHAVGDRVLTAIGQTIAAECSPHLVARHGGEEFAVLLCGVTLEDAAMLFDTLRATVAQKRFRVRETNTALDTVTVSVGITAIHDDEPVETAFARADRLLYAAKDQGRDRICAG
ncbi:GGDEF domain-containing protein [Sphingomonas sp. OK281]|uniref:GGDEF domain-containing protein n=1 Tax=Sphingomonas sp. OK281 TaxID=1881067 RepID=UPI0008F2F1D5|nr:GGDEF domain-containing protein [Sphingomonas sp. OK281]SFO40375.1 diguanylate cyclase [Sphingomonas sp. OK281]